MFAGGDVRTPRRCVDGITAGVSLADADPRANFHLIRNFFLTLKIHCVVYALGGLILSDTENMASETHVDANSELIPRRLTFDCLELFK